MAPTEDMLRLEAESALKTIDAVLGSARAGNDAPAGPLKPNWVARAQSIMVLNTHKRAFCFAWYSCSGFIISRIEEADGTLTWSPPCFVRVRLLGLGVLFGYAHVRSVTLGMSPTLANRVAERRLRTADGFDWPFVIGSSLAVHADIVTAPRRTWGIVHADWARGALVGAGDLFGALRVDQARNDTAYGKGTTPGDVLADRVARPKHFDAFYAAVDERVATARAREAREADAEEPAPGPALAADTQVLLSDGVVLSARECEGTDAQTFLERIQCGTDRAPSFAAIARAEELGHTA